MYTGLSIEKPHRLSPYKMCPFWQNTAFFGWKITFLVLSASFCIGQIRDMSHFSAKGLSNHKGCFQNFTNSKFLIIDIILAYEWLHCCLLNQDYCSVRIFIFTNPKWNNINSIVSYFMRFMRCLKVIIRIHDYK